MRTGITSLADALVSASVVLTAAIICAGAASADPSQQDQFVALLEQDQIPLIDNLPALVARAHRICGELDGGTSVETVVNEEMNGMFEENPAYHQISDRVQKNRGQIRRRISGRLLPKPSCRSVCRRRRLLCPWSSVRGTSPDIDGIRCGARESHDTCSTCIVTEHMLDMQFNAAHLCGDRMTDEVQSANQLMQQFS